MREMPRPYERYHHFKGSDYQILAIAKSADDLRDMVVYQGLYEPYQIYVRDLEEFLSPVDKVKYPEAAQEERFCRIGESTAMERTTADSGNSETTEVKTSAVVRTVAADTERITETPAAEEPKAEERRIPAEKPGERALKQKPGIDPVLLRFLDAETDDEKLAVLAEVRELLTPAILTPMELSLGMEPQEEVDQDIRFKQIRNTLQYKQKYEKSRRG